MIMMMISMMTWPRMMMVIILKMSKTMTLKVWWIKNLDDYDVDDDDIEGLVDKKRPG